MGNIQVHRYPADTGYVKEDGSIERRWDGWLEPEDRSWIAFIDVNGNPTFFLQREPSGAVVMP